MKTLAQMTKPELIALINAMAQEKIGANERINKLETELDDIRKLLKKD